MCLFRVTLFTKVCMPQHQHYWRKKLDFNAAEEISVCRIAFDVFCWIFSQRSWTIFQIWKEIYSIYSICWPCRLSTVSSKSDTLQSCLNHRLDQYTTLVQYHEVVNCSQWASLLLSWECLGGPNANSCTLCIDNSILQKPTIKLTVVIAWWPLRKSLVTLKR